MKYVIDTDGKYIGAFDTKSAPRGAIEAPEPPLDARQVWDGSQRGTIPETVPASVSRFQARRALKDAGVFDTVEAAISQADEFTQDAWADAQEFRRDSALIVMLGESLQLNLDALFIAAAKIEA